MRRLLASSVGVDNTTQTFKYDGAWRKQGRERQGLWSFSGRSPFIARGCPFKPVGLKVSVIQGQI